jgi:predicted site-specific integrase-resolvase
VNLREWALSQGIHPQTAYRWHRQGELPVPARKMGKLILVGDLVRDATELLTSLCARLYGQPSAANRAKRAL